MFPPFQCNIFRYASLPLQPHTRLLFSGHDTHLWPTVPAERETQWVNLVQLQASTIVIVNPSGREYPPCSDFGNPEKQSKQLSNTMLPKGQVSIELCAVREGCQCHSGDQRCQLHADAHPRKLCGDLVRNDVTKGNLDVSSTLNVRGLRFDPAFF